MQVLTREEKVERKIDRHLLLPENPITAPQLAALLGVVESTVFGWVARGVLTEGKHYWRVEGRRKLLFSPDVSIFKEMAPRSWMSEPYHTLPEDLLSQCKTRQIVLSQKRSKAIDKISNILKLEWNETVKWLDHHYTGWRGYEVRYPDGRVG